MITKDAALAWLSQQNHKTLTFWNYSMCVALIRYYIQKIGAPQLPSLNYAIEISDKLDRNYFDEVTDPQPGDIAVWAAVSNNPAGHTNIVVERHSGSIRCIGQNEVNPKYSGQVGSPIAYNNWTWPSQRAVRLFRPKFGTPAAPPPPPQAPALRSNDDIATEVIAGNWGNGNDRAKRLASAGYDAAAVQAIVNARLAVPPPAKVTPHSAQREVNINQYGTYWAIEDAFHIPHGTLETINPWPARAIPKGSQIKLPSGY